MKEIILSYKMLFFLTNLLVHYILLIGIVWSVIFPNKRIWPPPGKKSWQFLFTWACFYLAFFFNGLFIFLDWNSWILVGNTRMFIGFPLLFVGLWIVMWGISILGIENTSGVKDDFKQSGPYQFTRNPQYLGDIFLFIGLIMISNSQYLFIFNSLLIIIFLITPLAEEVWLEKQYGEKYFEYKKKTTRFL